MIWEGCLDWHALAEEQNTKLERAWMFRYDDPDAPCHTEGRDCPTWYLVHKFLCAFGEVGSQNPMSAMQDMERRS
jgi:hypothetical protein